MEEELKSSLNEELRIMDERAREGPYLSSDAFQEPISKIQMRPVQTLDISGTLGQCVRLMQQSRSGAVLVTDEGKLAGIITERDLLREVMGKVTDWEERPVSEFMTRDPDALHIEDPILFVMNRMHVRRYRHVPIVDEAGCPTHIVSIRDVLRFILDHFERHVSNVPPTPYRGPPQQYGG